MPWKGLLGCGREAATILRTPGFHWAVSQKYQGETQFTSGPEYHPGWWEQSAGNAVLNLHKDEFILYFWILGSPPGLHLLSKKWKKSGFASCMAVFNTFAHRLPPMPI